MTQADPTLASANAHRLTDLTERLSDRLEGETRAFAERRPSDIIASLPETQNLTNQYRRESAQVKAQPGLLIAAPVAERMALIQATQRFEAILARHVRAVEAARVISEGLVRTIATEVAGARALGTGYGASGQAAQGDGTAITLNRSA